MEKEIYFAGGCFWGVQEFFSCIAGVLSTEAGYANGGSAAPSYEEVCSGSGHAETVRVVYDPQSVEFKCTCSRERCAGALKTLPDEEIDSILADEGEIDMHCDYCGNHYIFNAMDIAEIRNNASPADPQVH